MYIVHEKEWNNVTPHVQVTKCTHICDMVIILLTIKITPIIYELIILPLLVFENNKKNKIKKCSYSQKNTSVYDCMFDIILI